MSAAVQSIIAITFSDDEADEINGRRRHRVRRRRRRLAAPQRIARWLLRCWPLLVCLLAAPLIFYEASRLTGRSPSPATRPRETKPSAASGEGSSNLNRLDHTTRFVGGVREPCLQILSPEEIQSLEFPDSAERNYAVKKIVYKTYNGAYKFTDNATSQATEASRFNFFTGYQTLHERAKSFKVNETVEVHCGFYSEHGGFKISDDDKRYVQTCEVVVSTCAFGGGDDLYQPIGVTEASLKMVCYVAFWDEITRSAQEEQGRVIGDDHMIGKWRIIVVRNLPFSDQRLNGKIPKMLSHRIFPGARYSIWVDSKSQFRRDPLGVLEALLWRTQSVLAISEHGARSSVYDEGNAVVKKHKATPEEVEMQLSQYRRDGFPNDKRFNGKKALAEASVIAREHTPSTNLLMCVWFNEVVRFTSRDQLSFPYVQRLLNIPGINMFPVCTRKDLVNSMGHKRKVKPLSRRSP